MALAPVGKVVRSLRKTRGLTLRAAAALAGTNHVMLFRIETGDAHLTVTGATLARALGPEIIELLRAEVKLHGTLDSLRMDAEEAAYHLVAKGEKVLARGGTIDWRTFLTPARLAKAVQKVDMRAPESKAIFQEVCNRWVDLMLASDEDR